MSLVRGIIRTGTQLYGESFIVGIKNPVVCKEYVRSMDFVRRIEIFIPLLPTLITQYTHFLGIGYVPYGFFPYGLHTAARSLSKSVTS